MTTGHLAVKIRKPDEIIPFRELIMFAPFFKAVKPVMVEDMCVSELVEGKLPVYQSFPQVGEEVICRSDLKEFIERLNRYVGYLQHHLDNRSYKNVLLQMAKTPKGREILNDFVSVMNFNENTHNEGNGGLHDQEWVNLK